jgi:hypothetical protein
MEFAYLSHPRWRITSRSECRTIALHSMPGVGAVLVLSVTGPARVSADVKRLHDDYKPQRIYFAIPVSHWRR